MPNGVLKLRLVDVYGKSIKDRITLKLTHRVLNHRKTAKNIDVKGTITITGLHEAPQGSYVLDVIPKSYRAAREFVNVGGSTIRKVVLQIHPKKAKPTFPSYRKLEATNAPVIGVLQRSANVAGHKTKTGAALWRGLTSPSPAFTSLESYKTRDKLGNLQFTFFHASETDEFVADIDVDDASGIRHVVDVIVHAVKKAKTHPYDIH